MKKFAIAVLALLTVGAIGGGGWAFMNHGDALASMMPERTVAETDPVFVQFDPLLIPVIDGDAVSRLVTLEIVLEVANDVIGDRIIQQSPRLNDAYLADLYGSLHQGEGVQNGVLNIAHVKRRLMDVSNSVMGAGAVGDVLVQMIGERPVHQL